MREHDEAAVEPQVNRIEEAKAEGCPRCGGKKLRKDEDAGEPALACQDCGCVVTELGYCYRIPVTEFGLDFRYRPVTSKSYAEAEALEEERMRA